MKNIMLSLMAMQLIISILIAFTLVHSMTLGGFSFALLSAFLMCIWALVGGISFGIKIFAWPFLVATTFAGTLILFGFLKHQKKYSPILVVLGVASCEMLGLMAIGQGG